VCSAPAARAAASLASSDAAATVCSPSIRATSSAASPTPPPAPSTRTVSPATTEVRRVSANKAVEYDCSIAAARANAMPSGNGTTDVAETATCSANPPRPTGATTRSPTATSATSSPTATTSPATSLPGVNGVGGLIW
jgi:hypothetical protein